MPIVGGNGRRWKWHDLLGWKSGGDLFIGDYLASAVADDHDGNGGNSSVEEVVTDP
jgi:hypothetical protein